MSDTKSNEALISAMKTSVVWQVLIVSVLIICIGVVDVMIIANRPSSYGLKGIFAWSLIAVSIVGSLICDKFDDYRKRLERMHNRQIEDSRANISPRSPVVD